MCTSEACLALLTKYEEWLKKKAALFQWQQKVKIDMLRSDMQQIFRSQEDLLITNSGVSGQIFKKDPVKILCLQSQVRAAALLPDAFPCTTRMQTTKPACASFKCISVKAATH